MCALRYSDILADILNRKHSKCICPSEYLAKLTSGESESPVTSGCQFGPNCNFTTNCHFEQSKCTCHPVCRCGLEIPPSLSDIEIKSKPQEQFNNLDCTCPPPCDCRSTDFSSEFKPISKDVLQIQPLYDKNLCTCLDCICNPPISSTELFPTCFRDAIKTQMHQKVCDELMKKECEEIKQIIKEEREKDEAAKATPQTVEKVEKESKSVTSGTKLTRKSIDSEKRFVETKQISILLDGVADTVHMTEARKSILKSNSSEQKSQEKVPNSKKIVKGRKREKSLKKKPKPDYQTMTKPTKVQGNYYCGCRDYSKRRPPRIRYYYSGSTENYGTKSGHKNCVVPPVSVPKHMGWLWNKEDPSKGIRERKGWPPGFIAKNIKNMMKVMKSIEATKSEMGSKSHLHVGPPAWKTIEFTEEPAPETEDPPLLHIHKKGRTYNITFCPKESDEDLSPIPIPFSITEKKRDDGSTTTDSSLEFELHSPKPKGKYPKMVRKIVANTPATASPSTAQVAPSSTKIGKKKVVKRKRSRGSEENNKIINWEEQQTQVQNIA